MKSKILFLLHLPPPVHGSAVVGENIKESKLINHSFNCRFINLGTSKNINEIGKKGIYKLVRYLTILKNLLRQLIHFEPNLVYLAITAKGKAFYKDALTALIIKLFGFKIVYHFHNKGVKTRQNYFVDNLLYRLVFKNAEIILLSKFLFYDVQKYISPRHVHYCPNGIPYDSDNINKSNEKDKTQLLFVSNLIVSKGVFQLLEACQILKHRGLLFHCNFVGEIGDVSKNKFASKVKELGLNEFIKYLGPKYGTEKNNIYTDADIFVLPTHFETFGIVILEAMMHKLPVISTFEGAIPEIVKNGITGILVHKNNVIELADKLEELIKNPMLRQKMGREGQNRFMKKFTIDNFENNLSLILKEIIMKNSSN